MACSPAKIAANRANAQKSTGPKTEDGKLNSRANALKHGLCASVVVTESYEAVRQRGNDWFLALHPQNEFQAQMVDKASLYSLRIDRCERIERRLRDRVAYRAIKSWDSKRRRQAEKLGKNLKKNPSEVVELLKRTPAGYDWLIRRWELLELAAKEHNNTWTPEQALLAYDLLGTPVEFRESRAIGVAPDPEDNAGLARAQIEELKRDREQAEDNEEVDRSLIQSDLFDENHPELKRLRRYEGTLHNRMRWHLEQYKYEPKHFKSPIDLYDTWHPGVAAFDDDAEAKPGPDATAKATATSIPVPPPEPIGIVEPERSKVKPKPKGTLLEKLGLSTEPYPHPPFDLTMDELPKDGSRPDLLKILVNRQTKREKAAEARREKRREKARQKRQA